MKAGRELDALVAEKVMGMVKYIQGDVTIFENEEYLWRDWEVPHYSDDIAEAWQVVEKMLADKWDIDVEYGNMNETPGEPPEYYWMCCFYYYTNDEKDFKYGCGSADTAPLAICLAALKAKGVE